MEIGRIARLGAAALGSIGTLAALVNTIGQFSILLASHFWTVLGVSWLLAAAALWPSVERRAAGFAYGAKPGPQQAAVANGRLLAAMREPVRRYAGVLLITLSAAMAASWYLHRQWYPEQMARSGAIVPTDRPIPVASSGALKPGGDPPATAFRVADDDWRGAASTPRQPAPLRLITFELARDKTSYRELGDWCRDEPEEPDGCGIRYFDIDGKQFSYYGGEEGFVDVPARGKFKPNFPAAVTRACAPYADDSRLLHALRTFAASRARTNALPHLTSGAVLQRAVVRRATVLDAIIPRGEEWRSISAPEDRERILAWLRDCVGLTAPVFAITVENTGDAPLLITGVQYYFLEHYGAAGGDNEMFITPLTTVATYVHVLPRPSSHGPLETTRYTPLHPRYWGGTYPSNEPIHRGWDRKTGTLMIVRPFPRVLDPALMLAPHGIGKFEVQLAWNTKGGATVPAIWAIELLTSRGTLRIGEFAIGWEDLAG